MPTYQRQLEARTTDGPNDPNAATITIEEAVVREAVRFAPPGSNNTAFAEVRFGDRRLLPEAGENAVVFPNQSAPEEIGVAVPGTPTQLTVNVWTENASFDHTVTVRIVTEEREDIPEPVRIIGAEDIGGATARPGRGSAEELTE